MEKISQAIERAKATRSAGPHLHGRGDPAIVQPSFHSDGFSAEASQMWRKQVTLNAAHLESQRLVAHDIANPQSKSFDMLRTQVLQSMETNSWQILGVTSPTAGCGKTVISINLALSIARQQGRSVLLVDMDLQKPQIANYLGLKCNHGIISHLEGRSDLPNSILQARIKNQSILVLPCETPTLNSSEWITSRAMDAFLQDIKRDFKDWTVIFDLPPVLAGDDVISILPHIDCALFVAAVGTTTMSEVKESNKHLESAAIVRVVLNKSTELPATYYSRYAASARRK
jgi:Mrp family chromosome partitioning ATPase